MILTCQYHRLKCGLFTPLIPCKYHNYFEICVISKNFGMLHFIVFMIHQPALYALYPVRSVGRSSELLSQLQDRKFMGSAAEAAALPPQN
jgi:hypothetical protein